MRDIGNAIDRWPVDAAELEALQRWLAEQTPQPWQPAGPEMSVGGCFVCFPRGKHGAGAQGDQGWAGAVSMQRGQVTGVAVVSGAARAGYMAGLLALREGPLLEAALRALPRLPDVVLVNATGRDHPRRAGLALHLGAKLGLPSIGITDRPLVAEGDWPPDVRGAMSPVCVEAEVAGRWVRTKRGTRPLVVHAGWRTDVATAAAIVMGVVGRARTPEPLRQARRLARESRAGERPAVSIAASEQQ